MQKGQKKFKNFRCGQKSGLFALLKKIPPAKGFKLLPAPFFAVITAAAMLICGTAYAYFVQTPAMQSNIVLQADSVTYFYSYITSDNAGDLLVPPVASKDSLAAGNIIISQEGSAIERIAVFSLMGSSSCSVLISVVISWQNPSGVFENLDGAIISHEVWCDEDNDGLGFYNMVYDGGKSGYFIESFPPNQEGSLKIIYGFAAVDELLDPVYKNALFKVKLSFYATKL